MLHPASSWVGSSLDVVVGIGSFAQAEAAEGAAAADQEQAQQDVDQGGDPEGEQVQRLVAVGVHVCFALVEVGLVNGVDPHVTWTRKKPSDSHLQLQISALYQRGMKQIY